MASVQNLPPATKTGTIFWTAALGILFAIVLLGTGLFMWFSRTTSAAVGGPFTLTDQSGREVTPAAFRGKYMLVYFGYTYCPDVCPTTLTDVAAALGKLGPKANEIVPVFITIDPARDTPAVLKNYVSAFSPRLVGLTGSPAEIAKVEREYHVYAAKHVTGPGPNDYLMNHSSFLYLMGPDGRFLAPIDSEEGVPQLTARLSALVASDRT